MREFLTYKDGAIKAKIESELKNTGYVVDTRLLNAADYGVPQLRKRAFIVAVRKDIAGKNRDDLFPLPTHRERGHGDPRGHIVGDHGLHITTKETLADLPAAGAKRRREDAAKHNITKFRRFVRAGMTHEVPSHHIVRSIGRDVLNVSWR